MTLKTQHLALVILTALFLLLTVLSMRLMRTNSFWYDEVWSVKYAGGAQYGPISLSETVNRVIEQSSHEKNPPGFYLVLNVWGGLVGWSEFAGWMLPFLLGLLSVATMYRLARELSQSQGRDTSTRIGISAAIILGLSAFFIQYLYELRVYIVMVLLTNCFLLLYWRLIDPQRKASLLTQLLYVLTVAVMFYMHFSLVLLLAATGLYHLVMVPKNRAWLRVTILTIVGALFFVPWISVLLHATQRAQALETVVAPPIRLASDFLYMFSNSNVGLFIFVLIFAFMARGRHIRFIWFVFLALAAISQVLDLFVPVIFLRTRYVIMFWSLGALLVAFGIDILRQRKVSPVWILSIWVLGGLWNYTNPSSENNQHDMRLPWKLFHTELQEHSQKGDVVLFHTPYAVENEALEFEYYSYGLPIARGSLTEAVPGRNQDNEYFVGATNYIANAPRVWVGVEQASPPNFRLAELQRVLKTDYRHCDMLIDTPTMRLDLYAHNQDKPQLNFTDQRAQIGVSLLEAAKIDADKNLYALVGISHSATTPSDTYSIGIHIDDAQGQLKAQFDFGLAYDTNECRAVKISTAALPPGTYTVLATAYEWQTQKRLTGQDNNNNGGSAERLALGTFTK